MKHLLAPGHTACAGCGQAIGARIVVDTVGPNVIMANATGCLEVFTTNYPENAWEVPWIHSLFENQAAVASGIESALRHLGKFDKVKVIVQGGDGGTADIGFQALSGMFERGHNILYVCYDNGAYMNTGIQRSSLTPLNANTTTSPPGKKSLGKTQLTKDMVTIAAAHGIPYAASASVGYPRDIQNKVKKALSIAGPKYIQIFVPCPLGWRHEPRLTYEIAQLAVNTGLYPLVEYENGEFTKGRVIRKVRPVEDFLKIQGRFRHLFQSEEGAERIKELQALADANIKRYGLVTAR